MLKIMKVNTIIISCLLPVLLSVTGNAALASPFSVLNTTQRQQLAQNSLSADQAAAQVRRQLGGRILSVRSITRKGRLFYRIKMLTQNGVVRIIRVDANSGRRF